MLANVTLHCSEENLKLNEQESSLPASVSMSTSISLIISALSIISLVGFLVVLRASSTQLYNYTSQCNVHDQMWSNYSIIDPRTNTSNAQDNP